MTRYAVWTAYGERCVYCGDRVAFRDLEIDHVIPKGLVPEQQQALLLAAGLAPEWEVDGLANLVCACRSCNRRKRDLAFNPRQVALSTTDAASRIPLIERLIERYAREARADKVRVLLEDALAGGAFTADDLAEFSADDHPQPLRLTSSVNFVDVALSELTLQDIERLRNQRLAAIEIEMQLPDKTRRVVGTVENYDTARAEGGFPVTATDLRCEGWYKNASATFRAVATADRARESFLSNPRVGVCDIDLMPVTLLQNLGPIAQWNEFLAPFETIGDMVRAGETTVYHVNSNSLTVKPRLGLITSVGELLRADLDGDGVEEILVAIHGRASGGSHGHSADPVLLTRLGPKVPFTVATF